MVRVVDRKWFQLKLEEAGVSQNKLAELIEIDRGALSLTLSGKRAMQLVEAKKIAQFLRTDVSEILARAGLADELSHYRIMLAADVDENGLVQNKLEAARLPETVLEKANAAVRIHGKGTILAAQVKASNGPLRFLDDALLLFSHTDRVEKEVIGALSICRNRKGEQILAKVESKRKTGEATLICVDGEPKEFTLHTATPILAIIP